MKLFKYIWLLLSSQQPLHAVMRAHWLNCFLRENAECWGSKWACGTMTKILANLVFIKTSSNVKLMSIHHLLTIILPLTSCDSFSFVWNHSVQPTPPRNQIQLFACYSIYFSALFSISNTSRIFQKGFWTSQYLLVQDIFKVHKKFPQSLNFYIQKTPG